MAEGKTDPALVFIWVLCVLCIVGLIVGYAIIKP